MIHPLTRHPHRRNQVRAVPLLCAAAGLWWAMPTSDAAATSFACPGPEGATVLVPAPPAGEPGRCRAVDLPMPLESVRWAAWIPGAPPGAGDAIAIDGTGRAESFRPASARIVRSGSEPSRPALLGLDRPLLGALAAEPFGIEERASASPTGAGMVLTCRQGSRPAGLVLDPGRRRLPESARTALRWTATGDEGFLAGLAGANDALRASVALPRAGTVDAPLPADGLAPDLRFVILCPNEGGSMRLTDLRLVPVSPGPLSRAALAWSRGAWAWSRGAWAWHPALWRDKGDALIAGARRLGVDRLFVGIDIEAGEVKDQDRLSAFVARAGASGVSVAVVEGDPAMALDTGRALALRRLQAIAAYQRQASPASRLAGLQYDIEPYLLPSYAEDSGPVLRGWADTIERLGREAPADIDIVLPFWLSQNPSAAAVVLPAVRAAAKSVTIMAYRTTEAEIQSAAEPLLAWGSEAGLPIRVALEAGPVGEEASRTYVRAAEGDLWALPQDRGTLVVQLDRPRQDLSGQDLSGQDLSGQDLSGQGPSGEDRSGQDLADQGLSRDPRPGLAFALAREAVVPESQVSFQGDEARMLAAASSAERSLAAWPAFAGFAFHGLLD